MPDRPEAVITTLLFTDPVSSTELIQQVGDEQPQRILEAHSEGFVDRTAASAGRARAARWRPLEGASIKPRRTLLTMAMLAVLAAIPAPSFGQPGPTRVLGEPVTGLFLPAGRPTGTLRRMDPALVRSRPVRIAWDVLSQPESLLGRDLIFDLFEDAVVSLRIDRLKRRAPDAYTLTGTVVGADPGFFTMVVERDVVLANVRVSGTGHYQLRFLGRGIHEIREIDDAQVELCGIAEEAARPLLRQAPSARGSLQSLVDDGSELDVLVVYTPAALADTGGLSGLRANIELGLSETNFAFANSSVSLRARIVHMTEVAYQESGNVCTDVTRLRDRTHGLDLAHALRDEYCADVISLVLADVDPDFGGCAFAMLSDDLPPFDFSPSAVHTAEARRFSNFLFAHELGHNLGGRHNRETGAAAGTYDFSFGYHIPDRFRTIMASSDGCSHCPLIPFYSNPTVTYDELPTGVPAGDPDSADNALTFELNREIAASWRVSCTDPPLPPLDLGLPPPAEPGDVLAANVATGELLRVDPSGDRGVISSDELGAGPSLRELSGVALESNGKILVNDRRNRALLRIDPETGDRTVFSGCVNLDCSQVVGRGPVWENPWFFAMERTGDLVVTDWEARAVFRVARHSGDRTVLSGCSDATCSSVVGAGPEFLLPLGVAIESEGAILVADGNLRAALRIHPQNGHRSVVSGCIDAACSGTIGRGVDFETPLHLEVEANGSILVTETRDFTHLVRIDASSGDRAVLSGCEDLACTSVAGAGPLFGTTIDVALDRTGGIVVSDRGMGALFQVDPASGDRTLLSGCVDVACLEILGDGPLFAAPVGIAVVPEPGRTALLAVALAVLAAIKRSKTP